jgi:hypothetical protein
VKERGIIPELWFAWLLTEDGKLVGYKYHPNKLAAEHALEEWKADPDFREFVVRIVRYEPAEIGPPVVLRPLN